MSEQYPNSFFACFLRLCQECGVPMDEKRMAEMHDDIMKDPRWKAFCPNPLRARYEETDREDYFLDLLLCHMGNLDLAALGTMEEKMSAFMELPSLAQNEALAEKAIRRVAEREKMPFADLAALCRAIQQYDYRGCKDAEWVLDRDRSGNFRVRAFYANTLRPERYTLERMSALYDAVNRELAQVGFQRDSTLLLDTLYARLLCANDSCNAAAMQLFVELGRYDGLPKTRFDGGVHIDRKTKQRFRTIETSRYFLIGTRSLLRFVAERVRLKMPQMDGQTPYPVYNFYTRRDGCSVPLEDNDGEFSECVISCEDHPLPEEKDQLSEVIDYLRDQETICVSTLMRHFAIGYNAASKLVKQLEKMQIVAPQVGDELRKVLIHDPKQTPSPEPTPRKKKATTRKRKVTP